MALELTCEVTQLVYTLTGDGVPRLLPECGCTLSTKCIREVLEMIDDGPFLCPVNDCGEENPKKASAEEYAKNGALIKAMKKLQAPQVQAAAKPTPAPKASLSFNRVASKTEKEPAEDLCALHKKKLEIVCIQCLERICSKCALFGAHKSHSYREEEEVHAEISDRHNRLCNTLKQLELTEKVKAASDSLGSMESQFTQRKEMLLQRHKDEFKRIKVALKVQQKVSEMILRRNLQHVEQGLSKIKQLPAELFQEQDQWTQIVEDMLREHQTHANTPNYINYSLLSMSDPDSVDVVTEGEGLLKQLMQYKDVAGDNLQDDIEALAVNFDKKTVSGVETIVDCPQLKAVQIPQSDIEDMIELIKEQEDAKGDASYKISPRNNILSEVSKPSPVQQEPSVITQAPLIDDEEPANEMVQAIEAYLAQVNDAGQNEIMMEGEAIGNQGAKVIANNLSKCTNVQSLLLVKCDITDAGAIAIFKGAIAAPEIQTINLDHNELTPAVFDSLVQLLQRKTELKVNMEGVDIQTQEEFEKISPYSERVQF